MEVNYVRTNFNRWDLLCNNCEFYLGCIKRIGREKWKREKKMKFNKERVNKIAIDLDKKQQLYLSSSKYNYKVLPLFEKMGYHMDYKQLLCQPEHYIFIINTIDKEIFRSQTNILAPAFFQGAKLLDIVDLMKLIDF